MEKINVTKPFLPPIEMYSKYLDYIWESGILTNNGEMVCKLEAELCKYLNVSNLSFVTNGTQALQLAIKALEIKGEIITTPFSFVATTSSIVWEGCKPVFVDIDIKTLCIDASKIEQAITNNTIAILATHVYGNPCDVKTIEQIAKKYNLKVIYDAAHAFGVTVDNRSILTYGDISIISFHATKLFHTIEGGGIVANNEKYQEKFSALRNFGYVEGEIIDIGTNSKNSEFHAAMGLANLQYADEILIDRKRIYDVYTNILSKTKIAFQIQDNYNYSYFPILFAEENILLKALEELNGKDIYPRRYFHPSLDNLPYLEGRENCIVAQDISERVLCLPVYYGIENNVIEYIANIVNKYLTK